jgi:D-glycero-alpha-D-manno-heptose-7-phosphate kinase
MKSSTASAVAPARWRESVVTRPRRLRPRAASGTGTVRARAPLRLGLAGGGTDVSPFCDIHGGCVLNATIDRYAYAVVRPAQDQALHFEATDRRAYERHSLDDFVDPHGDLSLHKAVYNEVVREFNDGQPLPVSLSTFCDAPPGSGLGSSSTLVVVMLRAFTELLGLAIDDYDLARRAYRIERVDCGLQGGRQDQYAATFGGFNFMEFYSDDQVIINPLRVKNWIVCELEASLLLYYTGVSRESGRIIADQMFNVIDGAPSTLEALHQIKQEAICMKESLLKANFGGIVESMREGWESKKRSARSVSTASIEEIHGAACRAGALAGKVSGAGGGGYLVFFVPPDRRMEVCRALNQFEGITSNCHFTEHGSQAWRV